MLSHSPPFTLGQLIMEYLVTKFAKLYNLLHRKGSCDTPVNDIVIFLIHVLI